MPFTKVGKDDYTSPSGRHFNTAQVRLWHVNGNKFPGQKQSEATMNKGYRQDTEATFTKGGPALGRVRDFTKTPDRFRDQQYKAAPKTDEVWGKGESKANPEPKGKSLPLPK